MAFLPITRLKRLRGANARNWPGLVFLDPGAPLRAAVWAQEAYEARHKLNPVNLLRSRLSRRHRRRMEIMGHEVEAQAVKLIYGMDDVAHREREIRAMRAGYDGLFRDVSAADLRRAMKAVSADAARWVRRNRGQIERWKL